MEVRLKASAPGVVKISVGQYHREFDRQRQPFELGGAEVFRLESQDVWEARLARDPDAAAKREWSLLAETGYFETVKQESTDDADFTDAGTSKTNGNL